DQRVDQVLPGGRAPARAKVVAGNGGIIGRADGAEIISGGDVVKSRRVVRPFANCVNGRIETADRRLAQAGGLLVDERGEARPQWRGATGAADADFSLAV